MHTNAYIHTHVHALLFTFIHNTVPADKASIGKEYEMPIEWKRSDEVMEKVQLFDGISPCDIQQG